MAKDDDELIRKFRALTSYLPVIRPAPVLTSPPPWAVGVAGPAPVLTGPLPPWPIGVAITPGMHRVCDWLVQHRDQRDTDEYRYMHNWLAEQMGLSLDTLEPSRWSNPNPKASESPSAPEPTAKAVEHIERVATLAATEAPDTASFAAETASIGTLVAVEVADTANIIGRKKRRSGSGNKPKLTEEEIQQLQAALRAEIKRNPEQGNYKNAREFLQRHAVPKIMAARELAKVDKTTVSNSVLDRDVIQPVFGRRHRPRRSE